MTEFLTYSGLTAEQLNDKLISLLRNVRQLLIETSLCSYPNDSREVVMVKEELVLILRGFTVFFSEFEFNVYNAPDLINLLIANAKRVQFTEDEAANKDRVFGVLLVFSHFQDGLIRLKKASEYSLTIPSESSVYLPKWCLVAGVAILSFIAGGYVHATRPSLFQGSLGVFMRKK